MMGHIGCADAESIGQLLEELSRAYRGLPVSVKSPDRMGLQQLALETTAPANGSTCNGAKSSGTSPVEATKCALAKRALAEWL